MDLDLARCAGARLERDRVERALDSKHPCLGLLGAELKRNELTGAEGDVVDPEHPRGEGPGLIGLVVGLGANLPALDEKLILERYRRPRCLRRPGPSGGGVVCGQVSIPLTRLRFPPGTNSISSPTETLPDSTRPAMILRASKR